jgi:hypothetical protein
MDTCQNLIHILLDNSNIISSLIMMNIEMKLKCYVTNKKNQFATTIYDLKKLQSILQLKNPFSYVNEIASNL